MIDERYRPLYQCTGCKDDYSWPAEDLRVDENGDPWCESCYDNDMNIDYLLPDWSELKPLIEILQENSK